MSVLNCTMPGVLGEHNAPPPPQHDTLHTWTWCYSVAIECLLYV